MSDDGKGTPKKQWKAFNVGYEFVVDAGDGCCTYALTNQQIAALLSMTEYLRWPTRWVKETGQVSRDFANDFTDALERALMNGCCPDNIPVQYRYNSDGDLERSLDGGNSWIPAPQYDVRNNSPVYPELPPETESPSCDGAASVAAMFEAEIGDQLTDDMSRQDIKELIETWVTTMHETSNPFIALVTVAANQIFALVISAVRAALTTEVYDQLKCIVLEHISSDASFTPESAEACRAQVQSEISGIAGLFLQHLIYLLGSVGMTNAARSGFVVGADCSDCSDVQRVWFQNAGGNIDGTGVEIFPDEMGVYTVTCDHFYVNGYYGIIKFALDPVTDGYEPCGDVMIISDGGAGLGFVGDCSTGTNNPLSHCWSFAQWYRNVPWTMTFTIVPC